MFEKLSTIKDDRQYDAKLEMNSHYYRALSYRMMNEGSNNMFYKNAYEVYRNINTNESIHLDTLLEKAVEFIYEKKYYRALEVLNTILSVKEDNMKAKVLRNILVSRIM